MYTDKVRCNNCMSIFFEDFIIEEEYKELCPVCKANGTLMDLPIEEFPEVYNVNARG